MSIYFFTQLHFTSDSPAMENFLFQEYLPKKAEMPNMQWYASSCNTKTNEVMRELTEKK